MPPGLSRWLDVAGHVASKLGERGSRPLVSTERWHRGNFPGDPMAASSSHDYRAGTYNRFWVELGWDASDGWAETGDRASRVDDDPAWRSGGLLDIGY